MNVVVANEKKEALSNLDVDIIKSISGFYDAEEIISMFKNFFFEKIIIDATSIKNYKNISSIRSLAVDLGADKIILLIPDELCTANYLSDLISVGIYNFTNNIDAIKRLILKPNSYSDVAKIQEMNTISDKIEDRVVDNYNNRKNKVIGFKNITEHAGASTLIYMLLKKLKEVYHNSVCAIEVDKKDFQYFNDKSMISVSEGELSSKLNSLGNIKVVLLDLNDSKKENVCDEIIYLMEPGTIKLNKLIKMNRNIFEKLSGKKIVLNRSVLSNKDVTEFEYESNSKIFYNIPTLDDRGQNGVLEDFLSRLGLLDATAAKKEDGNKIFGIFKGRSE